MWGFEISRTAESVIFMVFGFTWGVIVSVPAVHWWASRLESRKQAKRLAEATKGE